MNFVVFIFILYICNVKSYKFRIYPTPKQTKVLNDTLFSCFKLYNTALEHRKEIYRISHKSVSCYEQQNELPKLKEDFTEYTNIHSQVLQNVLNRVDLAFKGFFRRVKIKKDGRGFPRFKSLDRYDSFCFPQSGFEIKNNRIQLSKIGLIKIKLHRNIAVGSELKTCTIKREGKQWYCVLVAETFDAIPKKVVVIDAIGIDLGLTDFAVLSNGAEIKNPKYLKKSEAELKETQSNYSKRKSKKVKRKLTKLHRLVANQRKDFQHKLSSTMVNAFDLIAYEDLKIKQMIEDNKYNLQKHINDASWGTFISMLKYKAENAGKYCVAINPKGTTQKCSKCGTIVPKSLYVRLHNCTNCGFVASRDVNAALNIHKLGINLVDKSVCLPVIHSVFSPEAPSPLGNG